jgi:hypothetical protein
VDGAQINAIFREARPGLIPTIVVGGFVPGPFDATYLQRSLFLAHGSTYYLQFSPGGFSVEMFEAQLSDLVEELAWHHGTPPVVFSVSFGAGLVLQWLENLRRRHERAMVSGLVFVSPVACMEDILEPGTTKPSTLLGRAARGYNDPAIAGDPVKLEAWVEKSRQIMVKMFESGAQNKEALKRVLSHREVMRIRRTVIESMRQITARGAVERMRALQDMAGPARASAGLPIADVPAMVLFAEKESSIMVEDSPTRACLERDVREHFPDGTFAIVSNRNGSAVQHASLLFHCYSFEPHLQRFYRRVRQGLSGPRRFQHTWVKLVRPAHEARVRKSEASARAASERLPDDLAASF